MLGARNLRCRGARTVVRRSDRRGAVLVLAALFMVGMMAFLALSVDLGYVMTVQSELQRATDAAALAGAASLIDGYDDADIVSFEYLARNPVGGQKLLAENPGWENQLASLLATHRDANDFNVMLGDWDPSGDKTTYVNPDDPNDMIDGRFSMFDPSSGSLPSTVRIVTTHNNNPLFFARALGHETFNVAAESIARFQPRDIVLVLDFSGSMNDDSELKRIDSSGNNREAILDGMATMHQELGQPQYGGLVFDPAYLSVSHEEDGEPTFDVTFRANDVWVECEEGLEAVYLRFDNGATEYLSASGESEACRGTGSNKNRRIYGVYVLSEGVWSSEVRGDNSAVMAGFGLDHVAYPYNKGSWNDYINYVRSNSNVRRASYKNMYGFVTLMNYWLEKREAANETADLWSVSAQPVTAVKDAVDVFMDYISAIDAADRVGVVVYNSANGEALVEEHLTTDFDLLVDIVRHRQAGHYEAFTNIGDGIRYAREELNVNARAGAKKVIVLMTDGNANRPKNVDPFVYAKNQATLCAAEKYQIVTIALGNNADTQLMSDIASITDGVFFRVAGDALINDYEDDLMAVFKKIADDRPLTLVK